MLMGALECGTSRIAQHAFGAARLLSWLTGAPLEVKPTPRPGDARAADRPSLRAGKQPADAFSILRARGSALPARPGDVRMP